MSALSSGRMVRGATGPASTSCSVIQTIKDLSIPIYIKLPNFQDLVLKDDCMEGHHIGLNRMHPDRSSCLSLSANG